MRIPRRVDRAWDWLERWCVTIVVVLATAAAVGVIVVASMRSRSFSMPVPAAAGLGGVAAGALVYTRMARRLGRVRAEVEELLRENGALRHHNTVLAGGVIARGTEVTRQLATIPDAPPPNDPSGTRPLAAVDNEGGDGGTTAPAATGDAPGSGKGA